MAGHPALGRGGQFWRQRKRWCGEQQGRGRKCYLATDRSADAEWEWPLFPCAPFRGRAGGQCAQGKPVAKFGEMERVAQWRLYVPTYRRFYAVCRRELALC